MNKKLYINIDDFQNGSWCVGEVGTIKDWQKLALQWCDSDGNEELYSYIKKHKKNKRLLDLISDIWSIDIVEYDETNEEHLQLKEERES